MHSRPGTPGRPWTGWSRSPGRIPELQNPLHLVVLEERGAQNLRQLAVGIAPEGVHLPQTILGGHIALGHEEIVLCGRLNVGYSMSVAANRDRSREPGDTHVAIQHRQRGLSCRTKPQHNHRYSNEKQRHQPARGPQKNPQPAAFAAAKQRFTRTCGRLIH